jgi:CotH protein/lamin tail-like protein/chitobiase/beta-hexosaminidase-like protein
MKFPAGIARKSLFGFTCFLVSLLFLWSRAPANAAVSISEFLAANGGALRDEDFQSPDWIEIYNSGPGAVNLGGWHLTDDAGNLALWTFPPTNLPAGAFLVVFASGKNRATAGRPLHTNFQLDNDGEYLALVQSNGTVAHAFSPGYPNQRENVSYGEITGTMATPLIAAGATARVLVPADGALGLTWAANGFNDSAWLATNTPVGYSVGATANPLLALDVNDRSTDAALTTQAGFVSFIIASNISSTAIQTQATTRVFGGISVTVSNTSPFGYDDRLRTTPADSGAFTESLLLRDYLYSLDNVGTGGLDISIAGLAPNQSHRFTVWSFDGQTGPGSRVSDWYANGNLVTNNYSFAAGSAPVSNEQNRITFDATATGAGEMLLSGRRDATAGSFGVYLNALRIQTLTPHSAVGGVGSLMLSNNATAYIRIPFTVANPNTFQNLRLRMKYDDGFVAYINGQIVATRNAPGSPQWNSTATGASADSQSLVYEDIVVVNSPGLLSAGANVLAIHGLNVSATDADFLIVPELEGLSNGPAAGRYFAPPTPGTNNDPGFLGLVADTKFSADRGFYSAPFTVGITSATPAAVIYWTTNGTIPSPTNGTLYTGPILIPGTRFLRAAAFFDNYVPSVPDTHTYLFLSQVLQQPSNPGGFPTTWQAGYPADYGMDPNVVNSTNYGLTISNDLRSIPTLSIVAPHDAFWNPSTGIYVDATILHQERAASAELFNGDGTSEFQINCAVEMEGGTSRDNNRTPKHSFQLKFKGDYGPSKLDYNWFPGPVNEFDSIILRACFTDSWATKYSDLIVIPGGMGSKFRPEDSIYLRDIWLKNSMLDMGHHAGRGSSVHLYINGFYWGLYNPTERLDGSYFSRHLGGYEIDWDVLRDFTEVLTGNATDWNNLMTLINAGINNESAYQAVAAQVDIDNLIDYFLLHIHGEAEDWPSHNWYAAHRRANPTNGLPATKWIFLPWDQEGVLDQLYSKNRVDLNNPNTPAAIYMALRNWGEFRVRFRDRVQKHLFNGGALTASNSIARLQALAARVDRAVVGESARWGDAREFTIGSNPGHGQTFTRDEWWVPELQKLYTNWLANHNALTISRLQAGNLYPMVSPPQFSQFGGAVSNGFGLVLTHANGSGAIYFTVDGSDPRQYGTGVVAPTAQSYSTPILFNAPTVVRARVSSGGVWSTLVEAPFYPPQDLSKLALTEIMYHPPDVGATNGNTLEFLELENTGTTNLNLSGLTFSSGITFTFTNGTALAPGQFLVLVRNAAAFAAKYPGVAFHGVYTGQLDNAGEQLTLSHALGSPIFSVTYDDRPDWPLTPDLADFSLVQRNPGVSQAPDKGVNWRASTNPGGSPGADDPAPNIAPIVISEILAHTDLPQKDSIELFNPTATNVNIGGWYLTDDADTPTKYRIPTNTFIPAGGRLVFDEDDFNAVPGATNSFSLSSTGDDVHLFSAAPNGLLTSYSHNVEFGASFNGVSFGRQVNSAGEEFYPAQLTPSLGGTNNGPRLGPVVINEIQYHPDANGDEFVELLNITGSAVALFSPAFPTNAWKLSGVDFTFPTNVTLGAYSQLLIVATNPAAFRAKYSVPAGVPIFGPYAGQLQDSGENVELQAPDNPNTNGVPYVAIDAVRYNDQAPWPPAADGSGLSLQRVQSAGFGNEPLNWTAAAPTPGESIGNSDSDSDGMPDAWEQLYGTFPFVPDAEDDPDGDGVANFQEYLSGTHPLSAASVLRIEEIARDSASVILRFLAASNHTYSLLGSSVLDGAIWLKLADVAAQPTEGMVSVTNSTSGDGSRFYRLVTPAQP